MGRRGRPPYPDILTPREWEVLALLRDGLTNEAIAARLGVTHAAAKYHVSQILSKLGVATREEAAAWQPAPERRPWWAAALAWLRPVTLGKAALIAAAVAVLAGLGVLAWGVLRDSSGAKPSGVVEASPTASATPPSATPPEQTTPAPGLPPSRALSFRPGEGGRYARGFYQRSSTGVIDLLVENPDLQGAAFSGGAFSVSNDGRWLAFVYKGTVYRYRRDGGEPPAPVVSFETVWSTVLSPDGDRAIVYARVQEGQEGSFVVDMRSGSFVPFRPEGHDPASPAWSPDGTLIAFYEGTCDVGASQAIYLVTADGSGLRKLADYGGELTWSPDGRRIAFSGYCKGGIWLSDPDGGLSQLSSSNPSFGSVEWSPGGRLLSFVTSVRSGSSYSQEIHVLDTQNGQEWRVGDGVSPTWSPDGMALAYVRDGNLYAANVEGSSETQLAFPTQPAIASPAWLSDGSMVFAFAPPFPNTIYARDVATGAEVNLADGYGPVWSHDGKSIAFIGNGIAGGLGGINEIDTMFGDGSHITPVTRYEWSDVVSCNGGGNMAWSPDGRYLAYLNPSQSSLSLVSLDSSPVPEYNASGCAYAWSPDGLRLSASSALALSNAGIAITNFDSGRGYVLAITDGHVAWSPDGRRVAFTKNDGYDVIDLDGSAERRVAATNASSTRSLSWSPDGRSLLTVVWRLSEDNSGLGEYVLVVIDADTGESRDIAAGYDPTWSPDGRQITFLAGYPESIYIVDAGGGEPAVLSAGSGVAWSPDGQTILIVRP